MQIISGGMEDKIKDVLISNIITSRKIYVNVYFRETNECPNTGDI